MAEMTPEQAIDELAVSAVRYALDRSSYVYHFVIAAVLSQQHALTENTKLVIVRDIDRRLLDGMDSDEMRTEWITLRDALAAT